MNEYTLRVRLDPSVKQALWKLACEDQKTDSPNLSEYIRNLIFEKRSETSKEMLLELHRLENEIRRIGNNINQAVHIMHVSGAWKTEIETITGQMEEIIRQQQITRAQIGQKKK